MPRPFVNMVGTCVPYASIRRTRRLTPSGSILTRNQEQPLPDLLRYGDRRRCRHQLDTKESCVQSRRLTHKCARCGTEVLIVDGDFCERCQRELQSKVSRAIRDLSSKMELTEDSDGGSAGGGKRADGARDSRMFIRDIHREREDSD